jgi:hypothetical protein
MDWVSRVVALEVVRVEDNKGLDSQVVVEDSEAVHLDSQVEVLARLEEGVRGEERQVSDSQVVVVENSGGVEVAVEDQTTLDSRVVVLEVVQVEVLGSQAAVLARLGEVQWEDRIEDLDQVHLVDVEFHAGLEVVSLATVDLDVEDLDKVLSWDRAVADSGEALFQDAAPLEGVALFRVEAHLEAVLGVAVSNNGGKWFQSGLGFCRGRA